MFTSIVFSTIKNLNEKIWYEVKKKTTIKKTLKMEKMVLMGVSHFKVEGNSQNHKQLFLSPVYYKRKRLQSNQMIGKNKIVSGSQIVTKQIISIPIMHWIYYKLVV